MAGLLLQLVLLAPMDTRDIEDAYTESMLKEVKVMESIRRECTLDFEPFFGDYNAPIHSTIPPNRRISRYIHECIDTWIESLKKEVLFPSISSKTVSKWTANEVWNVDPDYELNDEIGVTAIDLERVYHRHHVAVSGPCEMRQKWYASNLQPRTYYAQGGTAFHSSKYLAKPFTDLCDSLPSTNRRTRVDPSRITIRDPSHDVAYYDLTSFTSNLHVQREFLTRLAMYCKGETVEILDAVRGVVSVDLGELIYDYVRHNLMQPSYTLPSKYGDPTQVRYHSVAGFLGVYGNIATATFIHGAVMAMLHDELDENNVAGDDGLDVTRSVGYTLEVVGLLGTVEDSKTFRDSEGCCIHLKRPIVRLGNRLIQGQLVTWPSLEYGERETDDRYPYLRNQTNRQRKDAIAGSVTAFLRSLESQPLTDDELELVDTFLTYVYDTYNLPREGCVPQVSLVPSSFVPTYERRFIGTDPIRNTIERNYANIATLPLRGVVKWKCGMLSDSEFRCNSTKLLNYLTKLGYLHQEKIHTYVFGYDGLSQLINEYVCPDPAIYHYTVQRKLPEWIVDFYS